MFGRGISRSELFAVGKASEGVWIYKGSTEVKIVSKKKPVFDVLPMPPVFYPEEKPYPLLIRFSPILIAPQTTKQLYLTFPLDVVIKYYGNIIDVIKTYKPKFTLYGDVIEGIIAKFWSSEIYFDTNFPLPSRENLRGIIPFQIFNRSTRAIPVSNLLLDTSAVTIFFNDKAVFTEKIEMNIKKNGSVELKYTGKGPGDGYDVLKSRGTNIFKALMEWGV